MRPKLLKRFFKRGELAFGVSMGIVVTRLVVDQVAKRMEKSAGQEESELGTLTPTTGRKLRLVRAVRGILHII